MNMKKIVAFGISAMMLFSTVANAELTVNDGGMGDDGYMFVDTLPTGEEIQARNPKVAVEVTQLLTDDEVKAATSMLWSRQTPVDTYDVYKWDVSITDMGGLFAGYDLSTMSEQQMCSLLGIELLFGTTDIVKTFVTDEAVLDSVKFTGAQHGAQPQYYAIGWTDTTHYPEYAETGAYVENASAEGISLVVALNKGTEVTITDMSGKITYDVGNIQGGAYNGYNCENVSFPASIEMIPAGEPEPAALDMTVDFNGKYDNGYVWQANITKGENDIDSFTAKFTADTETADRAIINVDEMVGKFTGEGTLSFNIGLDTTKTLTGAEFTVGAGAESKTVEAPLE